MADTRPWAIFLMGPTAAGKTDAAIALHEQLGHELISVDSAMVYRGMDVGSAKPSAEELARAPHRLIDIRDPADPYSAADFREDALQEMRQISAAGKVPLLVGGTMLYFKRLVEGVANLPSADAAIREQLEVKRQAEGLAGLHRALAEVDPTSAARIHPNDPQRLMRALEVFYASGRPMSELWAEQQPETFPWRVLSIALAPNDRKILHQRIAQRTHHHFYIPNGHDRGLFGRESVGGFARLRPNPRAPALLVQFNGGRRQTPRVPMSGYAAMLRLMFHHRHDGRGLSVAFCDLLIRLADYIIARKN